MPFRQSRSAGLIAFLILLRIVVGIHFFGEGLSKIQSGTFDCGPFLMQARGPAAPLFHRLLDDPKGHLRLSAVPGDPVRVDPDRHLAFWQEHLALAEREFGLNEEQREAAQEMYRRHASELTGFLNDHRVEIEAWLNDRRVEEAPSKSGYGSIAREQVPSLRDQLGTIAATRRAAAAGWFGQIQAMWDNYEAAINEYGDGARLELFAPWNPPDSPQQWINRILPWFDAVVGVLLVAGLATPLAAFGGMLLLIGVVATQPFWVPGVENTFPQWIELAALGVLAFARAGRTGGLDWFWMRSARRRTREEIESA
jgi:uncharacterized membrane protein YphA (DoxX/SURF4 family)